jgi:predicted RND superfamily exporter protein
MLGFLGMVDWRVTVISSNFVSLMLILTMALTIHLTERYLEVHAASPNADQRTLVLETVRTIALPCFYTTLTTIVAFVSLLVSGIRPVMDFGMMMVVGLIVAFVLAFVLFPAAVLLLKKDTSGAGQDFSNPFTLGFARLIEAHGNKILVLCVILVAVSGVGITRLRVENRFIDYFREKTAIFQGMSLIDQKLGGTTPLDLIIDFEVTEEPLDDFDEFDEFVEDEKEAPTPWFADSLIMEEIEYIHDYLDGLPETGEVLSLATGGKLTTKLNDNIPLDSFELAILHKKIPPDIKEMLVDPYVAEEPTQARFTMRIVEADQKMARGVFMARVRNALQEKLGFRDEQIRFTNMFVLYNNMLQSLFRSQILTIGMVFLGIMVMFTILFRSLSLAVIGIIPNMLPVTVVLGTMGWLDVPLDMMTITIASITIGISVDDTIHYIHRFQREFPQDRNYLETVFRCHRSIGRALYYTTVAITIGFSVLVLSNFIPTIYFGLFTGFAMLVALLGDLILLPQLILVFKPLGPEGE